MNGNVKVAFQYPWTTIYDLHMNCVYISFPVYLIHENKLEFDIACRAIVSPFHFDCYRFHCSCVYFCVYVEYLSIVIYLSWGVKGIHVLE